MTKFPGNQRTFLPYPAVWCLLAFVFSLSGLCTSLQKDAEFLKLNSESYITQSLKDFEAHQRNLLQGNGKGPGNEESPDILFLFLRRRRPDRLTL